MAVSMEVNLGGIQMKNPICTASGTFGYGFQFSGFYDVAKLGAITCKGVAAQAWPGNPSPRICEVTSGIMNSVGLENPGVPAFVDSYGNYLQDLSQKGCRVIVQAAGHSTSELIEAVEMYTDLAPWVDGIELNVSCPNLKRGGVLLGGTPKDMEAIVGSVRPYVSKPLLVKMAPVSIAECARAAEAAGADALSLINTISGMAIDIHTRKSKLGMPTGGVSGPAIHPIAVRMVWEAAQAVSIPINGMGGVESVQDAAEMILAGATTVTIGTANLYNPTCTADLVQALSKWAEEQGVQSISELIGAFEC